MVAAHCALQIYPHGSTDSLPFATMGSGSLNAMAMFEAYYKDDLTRDEAVDLVARAIRSGVMNDLGSGSNIDVCVITKDNVEYLRNYEYLQTKTYTRKFPVRYPPGTASKRGNASHGQVSQGRVQACAGSSGASRDRGTTTPPPPHTHAHAAGGSVDRGRGLGG